MNHRDRHPEEQRWEDDYGFGQRDPGREQYRSE